MDLHEFIDFYRRLIMAFTRLMMMAKHKQMCGIRNTAGLASLLGLSEVLLYQYHFEKPYDVFEIRKSTGKKRLIEAPRNEMKAVLRRLSEHLQCSYFFVRSPVAYGFILQPRGSKRKKNIVTNAWLHCGKKKLLNIDLADFYHQLSKVRVTEVFMQEPFRFELKLSSFLAEFTTYRNRIPMGSPTSAAISNFCCRALDEDLFKFCKSHRLIYSRYVDDLTFSTNQLFDRSYIEGINSIICGHGFRVNHKKVRFMGDSDRKLVTGLVLEDRPIIDEAYLKDLNNNILRLKHLAELETISRLGIRNESLKAFKQHILGKLKFVLQVYGVNSVVYKDLFQKFQTSLEVGQFIESFRWDMFPYI